MISIDWLERISNPLPAESLKTKALPEKESSPLRGVGGVTGLGPGQREFNGKRMYTVSLVPSRLYCSRVTTKFVVKDALIQKAKLLTYQSISVQTLTCSHQLWDGTERLRLGIKVAKIRTLPRLAGLSFRERARSSEIRGNSEQSGVGVEKNQPTEVVWASDQEASP